MLYLRVSPASKEAGYDTPFDGVSRCRSLRLNDHFAPLATAHLKIEADLKAAEEKCVIPKAIFMASKKESSSAF